jgi:tetratricopeptide (TPR) repeat protein
MKLWILLFIILNVFGCSSTTIQSDAIFKTPIAFKPHVDHPAPFIHQKVGHCGPATLAMAIAATGNAYDLNEIIVQAYSPEKKGTYQEAIIAASRRQGYLAIPISGFNSLLKEIESGHVVIVFENLGIKLIPQWHYALVTGYDLEKKELTMHSGPNQNQKIKFSEFELSWKLTDYWGLVVVPHNELSASADEITHLKAAAALEKLNKLSIAKIAYQTILTRWPDSLIAHIGLGNIYYALKDYPMSVHHLEIAKKLNPESEDVKNNLRIAQEALFKR